MGDFPGVGRSQQTGQVQPIEAEARSKSIGTKLGKWKHRAVKVLTKPVRLISAKIRSSRDTPVEKLVSSRNITKAQSAKTAGSIKNIAEPDIKSGGFLKDTPKSEVPNSHAAVSSLEDLHYNAAREILNLWQNTKSGENQNPDIQNLLKELEAEQKNQHDTLTLRGDGPANKAEISHAKKLKGNLQSRLKKAGVAKKFIKAQYSFRVNKQLNKKNWEPLVKVFNTSIGQIKSTQTPASKLVLASPGKDPTGTRDIFPESYKGGGISSQATDAEHHAVNLWTSGYKSEKGEIEYQGVRHGIHSAFGIDDQGKREAANLTRAKESVLAALTLKPGLLNKAVQGEAIMLNLASTSLVTPDPFHRGVDSERHMLQEQQAAFNTLASQKPLKLEIVDQSGQTRTVEVNLRLAQFNFGVNAGSVGIFSRIAGGWGVQDRMNSEAMQVLLGATKPGERTGGMAGEHIARLNNELLGINDYLEAPNATDPEFRAALEVRKDNIIQQKRIIQTLSRQIRTIYSTKAHRHESHDAYKMPARIALLTSLIDGVPLSNCKSGKDRTGMLDAEIKFLAAQIERDDEVPEPGSKLSEADQELFRDILLNSGNLEVQEFNTGAKGYKTDGVKSIDERIGDKHVRNQIRGMSGAVKK